jgi:outer membrane protein assembly factor BamB
VADVNGAHVLSGGSDGAMHALKIAGRAVWSWPVPSGLNTAALMVGPVLGVAQQENGTSDMGCWRVPANKTRPDGQRCALARPGRPGRLRLAVSDGSGFIVDNGGIMFAHDAKTGARIWEQNLGTIQKSSPVLADGKIYVGTENGRFFIIRPHADRAEILDQDWLGSEQNPEPIIAAPAVARGRLRHIDERALRNRPEDARRRGHNPATGAAAKPAAASLPPESPALSRRRPTGSGW